MGGCNATNSQSGRKCMCSGFSWNPASAARKVFDSNPDTKRDALRNCGCGHHYNYHYN